MAPKNGGTTATRPSPMVIPMGEGDRLFEPAGIAEIVQNFVVNEDGVLESIRGPTPFEPDREGGLGPVQARHFGAIWARLQDGAVDMTLSRVGGAIIRHTGWNRGTETLVSGLTTDDRQRFPDVFVVVAGVVVWSNGVDAPRLIRPDSSAHQLGFYRTPTAPHPIGPTPTNDPSAYYPNSGGYSHPGRIGTISDALDANSGLLRASSHFYAVQPVDYNGNLGPISPLSSEVHLEQMFSKLVVHNDNGAGAAAWDQGGAVGSIDDITRQFAVDVTGPQWDNVAGVRVLRTKDTVVFAPDLFVVARHAGPGPFLFFDNNPDSALVGKVEPTAAVPRFAVACAHLGRLVVADGPVVRISQPGLPGTFFEVDRVVPSDQDDEITGLASFNGRLIAFTTADSFDITDWASPVKWRPGIGCDAPASVRALPGGMLAWLSRDGLYVDDGAAAVNVTAAQRRLFLTGINHARIGRAVGGYDRYHRQYMVALPTAGSDENDLILTFDGQNVRRMVLGFPAQTMLTVSDRRRMVMVGTNTTNGAGPDGLFVLHHETTESSNPARDALLRSRWLQVDKLGLTEFKVRDLYIGFMDAYDGNAGVKFYVNGRGAPVRSAQSVRLVGLGFGAGDDPFPMSGTVINTTLARRPRLYWRKVTADLVCTRFKFELSAADPVRMRIAAFAFAVQPLTRGDTELARTPGSIEV